MLFDISPGLIGAKVCILTLLPFLLSQCVGSTVGSVQAQLSSKGNQGDGWMAQGNMNQTRLWLVLQGCQQVVTGRRGSSINKGKFGKGC